MLVACWYALRSWLAVTALGMDIFAVIKPLVRFGCYHYECHLACLIPVQCCQRLPT